jgi:chemotaxis protein MotB
LARKKKDEDEGGGLPEWMATYGDLVTLLLTFFILLFSMASLDAEKFEEIAQSLKTTFMRLDAAGGGESFNDKSGTEIVSFNENNRKIIEKDSNEDKKESKDESEEINEAKTAEEASKETTDAQTEEAKNLEKEINELQEKYGLVNNIKVVETKTSFIVRLSSITLFNSGSANIKGSALEPLKELSNYLKEFKKEIAIQGHTDNIPIKTVEFPTNWELSTRRATNVTLYFINQCGLNPFQLTASGNGEYKPIVTNDSEANREKNRRIDIVIEK